MAIVHMAVIKPDEFAIFKRLLGANIPDDYDGWLDLTLDLRDQVVRNGDVPHSVDVSPDEFAEWLMAHGTEGTPDSLNEFVAFNAVWEYDE